MVQYDDSQKAEQQAQNLTDLEKAMKQQEAAYKRGWWDIYEIFAELANRIARLIDPE